MKRGEKKLSPGSGTKNIKQRKGGKKKKRKKKKKGLFFINPS